MIICQPKKYSKVDTVRTLRVALYVHKQHHNTNKTLLWIIKLNAYVDLLPGSIQHTCLFFCFYSSAPCVNKPERGGIHPSAIWRHHCRFKHLTECSGNFSFWYTCKCAAGIVHVLFIEMFLQLWEKPRTQFSMGRTHFLVYSTQKQRCSNRWTKDSLWKLWLSQVHSNVHCIVMLSKWVNFHMLVFMCFPMCCHLGKYTAKNKDATWFIKEPFFQIMKR